MIVKSYLSQMLNPVAVFSAALVLSLSGLAFTMPSWGMEEQDEEKRTCSSLPKLPNGPEVMKIEEKLRNFIAFLNDQDALEKAARNEDWSQDTVLSAILVLRLASASKEQATTLLDLPDEALLNIINRPGIPKKMALVCKRFYELSWDPMVTRGILLDTKEKLENFIAFIDDETKFQSIVDILYKREKPLPGLDKVLAHVMQDDAGIEKLISATIFSFSIMSWKHAHAHNIFFAKEDNKDKEGKASPDFEAYFENNVWGPFVKFWRRFSVIKITDEVSFLMAQKLLSLPVKND
ncbi:MAG: hypothetical protein BGO67_07590 [Alphaproteobacteria bacterium 41-28]|nr:MAG: hypothetical protein BGO67_07590 [Alphaproteobacteria bacterium 41-28]